MNFEEGGNISKETNKLFMSVIHPAKDKDIEKFLEQDTVLVGESYKLYLKVTFPYILKQTDNLQWLYNVIELKAEVRLLMRKNLSFHFLHCS